MNNQNPPPQGRETACEPSPSGRGQAEGANPPTNASRPEPSPSGRGQGEGINHSPNASHLEPSPSGRGQGEGASHPPNAPRWPASPPTTRTEIYPPPPNLLRRTFLAAPAFIGPILSAATLLPTPANAEEISVTQYGASLYGLPFTVAQKIGAFTRAGIDITGFMGSGGGGTTVRNLFASETPYGEVAVGAALAAAIGGLPIAIINVGTRSVAEASIVTLPGSDIKTLADLVARQGAGSAPKKVALTSPKGVSEMLLLLALRTAGLDASKIARVYSGGYGPSLTLLEQGAVAAAALIEPLSIQRADRYRTIAAYRDLLPPMTTSVGITSPEFAKAHPEKLRAIIQGRREGVRAIYDDPAKAVAIAAAEYDLPPLIALKAVDNMIEPRMWSEGNFDRLELDRMTDALTLIGQLTAPPDWSKLIDQSFLPPDLRT